MIHTSGTCQPPFLGIWNKTEEDAALGCELWLSWSMIAKLKSSSIVNPQSGKWKRNNEEEMFCECKHGFSSVIFIWDAFLWIYQTMKISIKSDAVFCMLKFKLNVVCNFKQKSPAFVLI